MRLPGPAAEFNARLQTRHGIIGGYNLGRDYPHLKNHMLIAVTEVNTRASIDGWCWRSARPRDDSRQDPDPLRIERI